VRVAAHVQDLEEIGNLVTKGLKRPSHSVFGSVVFIEQHKVAKAAVAAFYRPDFGLATGNLIYRFSDAAGRPAIIGLDGVPFEASAVV
jgi:hypothetical protein